MNYKIKIKDLHKSIAKNHILKGINLEIESNSITAIVGKSGTGKSIFLKTLAGLLTRDNGKIEITSSEKSVNVLNLLSANEIKFSYRFKENALFDSLNVFENVALPLLESYECSYSKKEINEKVENILFDLNLANEKNYFPSELSGGMKKRVAFARALITRPNIVLFDEPTTGLDPERRFQVYDIIKDYRKRFSFTAIIVSHDIPSIYEIVDNVVWLDQGKIRFVGSTESIDSISNYDIKEYIKHGRIVVN